MSRESDASVGASADEIVADIERTREELGETVDALSEKLDVKAQARSKVQDTAQRASDGVRSVRARGDRLMTRAKRSATDDQGKVKPVGPVGAGVLVAGIAAVAVVMITRRR